LCVAPRWKSWNNIAVNVLASRLLRFSPAGRLYRECLLQGSSSHPLRFTFATLGNVPDVHVYVHPAGARDFSGFIVASLKLFRLGERGPAESSPPKASAVRKTLPSERGGSD